METLRKREVGALLLASVAEAPTRRAGLRRLINRRDLGRLVVAADAHRVSSHVHAWLRDEPDVDPIARERLARSYREALARHLRAMADLTDVAKLLDAAGVPWLVFKGPVLAELVYGDPGLRWYGDLDLLVSPHDFPAAVDALQAGGLELMDRNWEAISSDGRGQVHPVLRFGTTADLHWDVLISSRVRSRFRVRTEDLVERRVVVDLAGHPTPILEPTDALLHLVVHAGLAGGHRLSWLKDIERHIAVVAPDWEAVVARAADWKARLLVAVVLRRARRCVDAAVPDGVLRALASGPARTVGAIADLVQPVEHTTAGHYEPVALATRFLRDDLAGTAAAAFEAVRASGLTSPQLRRAIRRAPTGAYAEPGFHASHPSGGEQGRRDYLDAVARRRRG